jgi:hypothetical protein
MRVVGQLAKGSIVAREPLEHDTVSEVKEVNLVAGFGELLATVAVRLHAVLDVLVTAELLGGLVAFAGVHRCGHRHEGNHISTRFHGVGDTSHNLDC